MSELTNTSIRSKAFLWQLLSTASALALIGTMGAASKAKAAEDESRPTVWIELGGALQRQDTGEEKYVPPFLLQTPRPGPETVDPLSVGHLPRSSFDAEGKVIVQPEDSSWSFTAAARFGRAQAHQQLHQQSHATGPAAPIPTPGFDPIYQHVFQFIDAKKKSEESHVILDFQVGKDVGFGVFGRGGSSVLNAGVRFAQFNTQSSTSFASDPDAHLFIKSFPIIPSLHITIPAITNARYHINQAYASATRSFHGIGPSLAWNASAPVAGNVQDGQIVLDWGVNAALLFGRQRADVHHHSTAMYHHGKYGYNPRVTSYPDPSTHRQRSRSVTVPNIGAFAGVTWRLQNFKVSAGYRADFFFNAMDGGVDAHQSEDQKFYGPFATISLGLGG